MDKLSLTTHYIKMVAETGEIMATATGFLYRHESGIYLITNAHNFTRMNYEANERIGNSIAYPTKLIIGIKNNIRDQQDSLKTGEIFFNLYEDEYYTKPKWYIHPKFGYKVDVVAVPFAGPETNVGDMALYPINDYGFVEGYQAAISDDVFILGYPLNLTGDYGLPIWKRGSIATEPSLNLNDLPTYLIDTATRPGMSGSPVIIQRSGFHARGKEMASDDIFGTIRMFLGVYSGRLGSDSQFEAQLGIVWKKEVIDEIIEGNIVGDIEFHMR